MDIIISECFHLRILKYQNATRGVWVTFVFFLVIDKADKAPLNAVLNDQEHSGIVFLHSVYFFAFVIVIVFVFIICVCIFWLQAQLAPFAALNSPGQHHFKWLKPIWRLTGEIISLHQLIFLDSWYHHCPHHVTCFFPHGHWSLHRSRQQCAVSLSVHLLSWLERQIHNSQLKVKRASMYI